MLKVNELKIPLDAGHEDLVAAAAKALKCPRRRILSLRVTRRAVDSRNKNDIVFVCNAEVTLDGDEAAVAAKCAPSRVQLAEETVVSQPALKRNSPFRPVIAGFGPAGIFAALTLARAGLRPLVIERGRDADTREKDIRRFWTTRQLDGNSNMQFGEGGAGTFSDGKLNTGIKNPLCRAVLEDLAAHGAPAEILYSAKPHIGTDKLPRVVKTLRKRIEELGGEVLFETRLTGILVANDVIHGVTVTNAHGREEDWETDALILAIGHSARDTYEMLAAASIRMEQKAFSLGARIEHPRELIDKAQYGAFAGHPTLGAADYKLSCHGLHERGAYTFCMCPGGVVVTASSEHGGLVVNGMSPYARDGENSNAALLVGVDIADFPDNHPLAGMYMQRKIEQQAFALGGRDYTAPAQLVDDFLADRPSVKFGAVRPSCPTGVTPSDLRRVLPKKVTQTMAVAIGRMNAQLRGFALPEAVLTAPETRSSSPVRIVRDEFMQSPVRGLYPCGEGAGYAGGIVSAAVDGIKCAYAVMSDEA